MKNLKDFCWKNHRLKAQELFIANVKKIVTLGNDKQLFQSKSSNTKSPKCTRKLFIKSCEQTICISNKNNRMWKALSANCYKIRLKRNKKWKTELQKHKCKVTNNFHRKEIVKNLKKLWKPMKITQLHQELSIKNIIRNGKKARSQKQKKNFRKNRQERK